METGSVTTRPELMSPSDNEGRLTAPKPKAATFSDAVMSTIRGGQEAQRLIFSIREGCAPADVLLDGLQAVQAVNDADRLRGFCRELQKSLERRA